MHLRLAPPSASKRNRFLTFFFALKRRLAWKDRRSAAQVVNCYEGEYVSDTEGSMLGSTVSVDGISEGG